jgi:hypothetical protein
MSCFGPARLMKMPLSAGVTSMRINGIIDAAWARRSDFTDNRPSLGTVRNRTAHCAIGDRLENWKRLGDRLPVFLTEATQGSLRGENRTSSWQL